MHIRQEMEMLAEGDSPPGRALHPIELFARAYGLADERIERTARTS
jgi:hypothetical protein